MLSLGPRRMWGLPTWGVLCSSLAGAQHPQRPGSLPVQAHMGLRESPRYLTRQDVSLVHTLPTLSLGHLAGWWPEEVEGRGQGGRHPPDQCQGHRCHLRHLGAHPRPHSQQDGLSREVQSLTLSRCQVGMGWGHCVRSSGEGGGPGTEPLTGSSPWAAPVRRTQSLLCPHLPSPR